MRFNDLVVVVLAEAGKVGERTDGKRVPGEKIAKVKKGAYKHGYKPAGSKKKVTKQVFSEDRKAPVDTMRPLTKTASGTIVPRRSKMHGHMNNYFNQDNETNGSGTTQAASGFWGDTNTKMNTFVGMLPRNLKAARLKASSKRRGVR